MHDWNNFIATAFGAEWGTCWRFCLFCFSPHLLFSLNSSQRGRRIYSVFRTSFATSTSKWALVFASSRLMVIKPQSGASSRLFGSI